jgi:hypothetical protein
LDILEKVIQDGLSDKTSPRARLAIYMQLTHLADEQMDTLQRVEGQDVSFLLTGLKLVKAKSRFASR